MSRYKVDTLKTVQVLGEQIEIRVNSDGEFTASVGLDHYRTDTLKELMTKLRRSAAKRRVTVAIPATLLNVQEYGPAKGKWERRGEFLKVTCRRVTLTGINPKTRDILFTDDATGEKSTSTKLVYQSAYGRTEFAKPMTQDQIAEWERLYTAKHQAADAFRTFSESIEFKQVFGAVKDAIAAAVDDPREPPAVDDSDSRPLVDTPPEDPV